VLLALYDAVHAVASTTAGAMSLTHKAKVDVVTGTEPQRAPDLGRHHGAGY